MNIAAKIKALPGNLRRYWKKPPEGRYMSFREIASLSVGGIGVKFVSWCFGQMIISTTNSLLANTIGIDPVPLYIISVLSIIAGIPLTGLRAYIIDNSRNIRGKYRPYILTMGIPTAILGVGFIMMPYERMSLFMKCAVVLAYNIGFQFFYNFYTDAYDSIINVLSPDSIERSDVVSVKCVVENLSPSIVNIIFPLLAKLITGENTIYDLKINRILFPVLLTGGLMISLLIYANTEEKIIQAKQHRIKISFSDALKAVAKNKYFWIISLAGWIGFLEGSIAKIPEWMYNYQHACSVGEYTVIVALIGNASFWPNLIGPFLIRKFGKKKILIYSNLLNVLFIAMMLPLVRSSGSPGIMWPLVALTFINQFFSAVGWLMGLSINPDIRDYQQYVTGERIDGMFAAVGLIGSVITLATNGVLPAIYEKSGLNKTVALSLGYDGSNVYDVLENPAYFESICSILVIASVIGAALNVIPYFFYDLTEEKQKGIVTVLKLKALAEDRAAKGEGAVIEAKQIIKDLSVYKKGDKKSSETKEFVTGELTRYKKKYGKRELKLANAIISAGPGGDISSLIPPKSEITSIRGRDEESRRHKRNLRLMRSYILTAEKLSGKFKGTSPESFGTEELDALYLKHEEYSEKILSSGKRMKRDEFKALINEKKRVSDEIAALEKKYSLWLKYIKPYTTAKATVSLAEFYDTVNR